MNLRSERLKAAELLFLSSVVKILDEYRDAMLQTQKKILLLDFLNLIY